MRDKVLRRIGECLGCAMFDKTIVMSCSSGEKIDRLAVFSDLPIANGCDYRHADGTVGKGIAQRISIQSFALIGKCFDSERVD